MKEPSEREILEIIKEIDYLETPPDRTLEKIAREIASRLKGD